MTGCLAGEGAVVWGISLSVEGMMGWGLGNRGSSALRLRTWRWYL
jgi:hypothetical protein